MKEAKRETLDKLVNSSGFLFQIAIEHLVSSNPDQPWHVVSREHPWKSKEGEAAGFIDLILAAGIGMVWMVCECKRTRDGDWIFIIEPNNSDPISTIRCPWVAGTADGIKIAGWDDVTFRPSSPESTFCVIRGTGEKDPPLLERMAGHLLLSVDSLIEEDIEYVTRKKQDYKGVYIPAIITNSRLLICHVDPSQVSLSDGTFKAGEFAEVPMIRFKKTLSFDTPPNSKANDLFDAARERERTVLIINSIALLDVLKTANMKKEFWEDQHPWDLAFSKLKQRHEQR